MSGQRVWLTADGRYVPDGDPDAVSLAYGVGDDVPPAVQAAVTRKVHTIEEEEAEAERAAKRAARSADKMAKAAEDK